MMQKNKLHLGVVFAIFIFLAIGCNIEPPPSSKMTDSTPNRATPDPTKDKIKALKASADDLGKLDATNNISPNPKIDGKVAIVRKYVNYYEMVGLDKTTDDFDELSVRNYGFTKDDLAISRDEINYLIQNLCLKGKQISFYYTEDSLTIPAYELKCDVSVIHFKDKDTREYIAKKTFTSRKLDKNTKAIAGTEQVYAQEPSEEIEKYIKAMVGK